MKQAEFEDLPHEVALHVFSFLPVHTVRCVLPRVSRAWSELAHNPSLWRTLEVEVKGESGRCPGSWPAPLAFLRATPEVRTVRCGLIWEPNLTELLKSLAYRRIRKLTIANGLKAEHLKFLSPHLEELQVDELHYIDDFSALQRLSKLSKLHLFDLHTEALQAFLPHVPSLRELKVTGRIMGQFTKPILDVMQNLKDITLALGGDIDPSTIEQLAKFPRLRRFSAVDIAPTLPKLLALRKLPLLDLRLAEPFMSPVLPSSSLITFFSSSIYSSLIQLQLLDSRLNDAGALVLRTNCPNLRWLEVEMHSAQKEELTELGVLHFLHLQHLGKLEVRFLKGPDWCHQRHRWKVHSCDANLPCPVGLHALLCDWEEYPIVV